MPNSEASFDSIPEIYLVEKPSLVKTLPKCVSMRKNFSFSVVKDKNFFAPF